MRSTVRYVLLAFFSIISVVLTGCGDDPVGLSKQVSVSLVSTAYNLGDPASVVVTNISSSYVADPNTACGADAVLQRQVSAGQWVDVIAGIPDGCIMGVAYVLGPGESSTITMDIPTSVQTGTYRFAIYHKTINSAGFSVQ